MKKEKIVFVMALITIIISSIISVYAANYIYNSQDVEYDNTGKNITSTNVQGAIDELYTDANNYSSINTRVTNLESHFIASENRFEIGNSAGYVDRGYYIKDSSGINRGALIYNNNVGNTSLVAYDSSGTWGNFGPLSLYGSSISINGTSIGNLIITERISQTVTIDTSGTQVHFSATKSGYTPIAYNLIHNHATSTIGSIEALTLGNGSVSGYGFFKDMVVSKSVTFYFDVTWMKNL